MTQHGNVALIEELDRAFHKRDWDKIEELHAENVVLRAPDSPQPRTGRKALLEWYMGFFRAFPDMDAKLERVFAQGEWVCGEFDISGTHTGPLAGGPGGQTIPATGKKVRMRGSTIYQVQGGKVAEVHEYFDQLGFLSQLGLIPEGP